MTKTSVLSSDIEQELAQLQELIIQVNQLIELIEHTESQNIRTGLVSGIAPTKNSDIMDTGADAKTMVEPCVE